MQRVFSLWCISVVLWGYMNTTFAESYYVTRMPARIIPTKLRTLQLQEAGEGLIVHPNERAKKGDLIICLNPESTELLKQEFDLECRQDEAKRQEEILQLKRQKEELEFVRSLPTEQRGYVQQKFETKGDARLISVLDEKIKLLQSLTQIEKEKKRIRLEQQLARTELRMPFDGLLHFHIPLPENTDERVQLPSGEPLVTVVDDSELFIAVSVTDSELVHLPTEALSLRISDMGERSWSARWHHRALEKNDRAQSLVYYFSTPAELKAHLWTFVGANLVAELFYEGTGIMYVRKDELAARAVGMAFETWEDVVKAVYPGFRLFFCGETHLALLPNDGI